MSFDRLPTSDLVVFTHKRLSADLAAADSVWLQSVANKMVEVHQSLETLVSGASFREKSAYSELTIRDLMKWCEGVGFVLSRDTGRDPAALAVAAVTDVLCQECWAVYGARFRTPECRVAVYERMCTGLNRRSADIPLAGGSLLRSYDGAHVVVAVGGFSVTASDPAVTEKVAAFRFCGEMSRVHRRLAEYVFSPDVVASVGIASGFPSLREACHQWLTVAAQRFGNNLRATDVAVAGVQLYRSYMRLSREASATFVARVVQIMSEEFGVVLDVADMLAAAVGVGMPCFSVTPRVEAALRLIVRAASLRQPVLLVGPDGCGKSEVVVALAAMLGKPLERVCVTGETETSELVGSISPSTMQWSDGPVTRAIRSESWCLVDNLDAAEPVVNERLNPLLESSPVWLLSEKDDSEVVPIRADSQFLLLATMTADASASTSRSGKEPTPALYNRFAVVFMNDVGSPYLAEDADTARRAGRAEVATIVSTVSGGTLVGAEKLSGALMDLKHAVAEDAEGHRITVVVDNASAALTLRTMSRVADCFMRLKSQAVAISDDVALFSALQAVVVQSLRTADMQLRVRLFFESRLERRWAPDQDFVALVSSVSARARGSGSGGGSGGSGSSYVLDAERAPARYKFAQATALGILCGYPVLLEGPAATGRISLCYSDACVGAHSHCD